MVTTKHIKSFLGLSLILMFFCIHLTSARAALLQLRNDNGTAEGYHSQWQGGNIIGTVLTPNPAWSYPVKVNSVEFMLHRFTGAASSATVRARIYSVVGGVPGALLGSSAPTTINTFYPTWASISLTSANITLSSPAPFMVAIEYTTGISGSVPSTLTDNQNNIATGKNFYSLNGGATWIDHYNFWAEPGNVGYNMIRATMDYTLPLTSTPTPTPTPTLTPTPTPTHTPTPQPTTEWKIYLPFIAKNWSPPTPPPTPVLPTDNFPCLEVITGPPNGIIFPGCVTGRGGPRRIVWRYDSQTGAINGFDDTFEDNQGVVFYRASIDIQRSPIGQITSYNGTVSGDTFPSFTEIIVNKYNGAGGLIGADVVKTYTGGFQFQMEITKFCTAGYRVRVFAPPYNGQEVIVGICP
jgi:hypothetical protein